MGLTTDPTLITPVDSDGNSVYDIPEPKHDKNDSINTEIKYPVPQKYKNLLKAKMDELQAEIDDYRKNHHDSWDSANAKWYKDMKNILQDLLSHLEAENEHDMKLAQIRVTGLTNDAIQHIPSEVYMFIIKGDQSLKTYYQQILRKD